MSKHKSAGDFFESWLREDPTNRTLTIWVTDDGRLAINASSDGKADDIDITAINLDAAATIMHKEVG